MASKMWFGINREKDKAHRERGDKNIRHEDMLADMLISEDDWFITFEICCQCRKRLKTYIEENTRESADNVHTAGTQDMPGNRWKLPGRNSVVLTQLFCTLLL